ncbi:hypothetical protein QVD17_03257 [Tagetes erecta]|uniref:Protein kinase domain-containing protein n=1 Tax=Tagetes erecta TaxID=13708 RepID=A0AAD8LDZ9_TARER|nr:hypothetical protein QVD17_03257 [Tagetes erecta]
MATAQGYLDQGNIKHIADAADPRMIKLEAKDSIYLFSKIIYQCLHTSTDRPTLEVIINFLEKALQFQAQEKLKIPLQVLRLATDNFDKNYLIGSGGYGAVYKAELEIRSKLAYDPSYMKKKKKGLAPIAKRHFEMGTLISEMLDQETMDDEAYELGLTIKIRPDHDSLNAFSRIAYQCLAKSQAERPTIEVIIKELNKALYFQENRMKTLRISLEDITVDAEYFEMDEKIIVYDQAAWGSLGSYLNNTFFTWNKRLKVCIDIANGLKFLHGGDMGQYVLIHRNLTSSNILLTEDWKAKICGFELSITYPANQEIKYVMGDDLGSLGYCDPLYSETKILTKESDIYSFGVILFEILCGRFSCQEGFRDETDFLGVLAKHQCQVDRLDEIVFEEIKEQIVLNSFATFQRIALQCLHDERKERPTAADVLVQLQKALEFQEAYETRLGKLHKTFKELVHQFSKSPAIYSTMRKKDIYNVLSKGILHEDDKLITPGMEPTIWDLKQLDGEDYHSEESDVE